eukprot:Em0009g1216a
MSLLSSQERVVVGESVIVIKKLLQLQPKENKELIAHMARLVDSVKLPMAKASILWLAAKIFPTEEEIVKLQTINLAAKLCTVNPKQTRLLCQYILNMAKYDQNYDVRDRARFLRQLVQPEGEQDTALSQYAKKILMATKPAPVLESNYKARAQWQLGSLSHLLNAQATGYIRCPTSRLRPQTLLFELLRNQWLFHPLVSRRRRRARRWEVVSMMTLTKKKRRKMCTRLYQAVMSLGKRRNLIRDRRVSIMMHYVIVQAVLCSNLRCVEEEDTSEEEEKSGDDKKKEEDSEEEEEEEEEDSSESEEDALQALQQRYGKKPVEKEKPSESSEEEESASEKSSSEESEEAESPKAKPKPIAKAAKKESSLLLLDDWDSAPTVATVATLATGDMLKPLASTAGAGAVTKGVDSSAGYKFAVPTYVPKQAYDLLNRISGNGLSVTYTYTRRPHLSSSKMIGFELLFQNTSSSSISNIEINKSQLQSGMQMTDIPTIPQLGPGASISVSLGINFNDTLQPASFNICVAQGMKYPVQIEPLVGEVLKPVSMSEEDFITMQEKLTGMHEGTDKALVLASVTNESIKKTILEKVNMFSVDTLDATLIQKTKGKGLHTERIGVNSVSRKWRLAIEFLGSSRTPLLVLYVRVDTKNIPRLLPRKQKRVKAAIFFTLIDTCRRCLLYKISWLDSGGKKPTTEGYTHDWTVIVKGEEGHEIKHFVEKVVFYLHESFPKPKRVVKDPPFQVSESGYGSFNLPVEVYFRNKDEPKKVKFDYDLLLPNLNDPPINQIRTSKLKRSGSSLEESAPKKKKKTEGKVKEKKKRNSSSSESSESDSSSEGSNSGNEEEATVVTKVPKSAKKSSPNNWDTSSLKRLHKQLNSLQDPQQLQEIVNIIEQTGLYNLTASTFDFDLCKLDDQTLSKLSKFVEPSPSSTSSF